MFSHFKNHGIRMGFKSPVKYTKSALNVIKHGQLITSKSAYVNFARVSSKGIKIYNYVGLNRHTGKITTYMVKEFAKIFKFLV